MARPVIGEDQLREIVEAVAAHGTLSKAARALGMAHSTANDRFQRARAAGMHLSDGAQNAMHMAGLNGGEAKGGWIHNYDNDGKKVGATRWSAPEMDVEAFTDHIRTAFEGIPPAPKIAPPKPPLREDLMAFLPHADWHLGMVANVEQTGRDYNRKLAVERLTKGMGECLDSQPACEHALILNAGDLTHANDDTDRTPRSKHVLKVEGTHYQNLDLCIQTTATLIEMALKKHKSVKYRAISGNHDPSVAGPLSFALRERYRNEKRVEIVCQENEFWQENWGNNFFAGHHGHGRSHKDVAAALPAMYPNQWGSASHWFYFTAHRHNFISQTLGSVRHIQFPSVCSLDTHAAWLAYLGDSALMAMTFKKSGGVQSAIEVAV